MDIVYILGTASVWGDNELRYSLRSIEKHFKQFDQVYIIGHKPNWITNIIHIPCNDESVFKEYNIYRKIIRACQEQSISQDFLFMNDDHFINGDFDILSFPYFSKGDLSTLIHKLSPRSKYRLSAINTARALHSMNLPTYNFDTHTPIIYNKERFLTLGRYNWSTQYSFIVKSMYCNTFNIAPISEPDYKINTPCTEQKLNDIVSKSKVWSIGNKTINDPLTNFMNSLYPTPSRFELQ